MIAYKQINSWMRRNGAYKYELLEPYVHDTGIDGYSGGNEYAQIDTTGKLSLAACYQWDGPSGPAIDTTNFMRGSLVHDALYQLIREGVLPVECRRDADFVLYAIVREDGMWRVRAAWVLAGVRVFGQLFLARG